MQIIIFTRKGTSRKQWSDTGSRPAPGWRAPRRPVKNTWQERVKHLIHSVLNKTPWANHPQDVMQRRTPKLVFLFCLKSSPYVWTMVSWEASSIDHVLRKRLHIHIIRVLFLIKAVNAEETNYIWNAKLVLCGEVWMRRGGGAEADGFSVGLPKPLMNVGGAKWAAGWVSVMWRDTRGE